MEEESSGIGMMLGATVMFSALAVISPFILLIALFGSQEEAKADCAPNDHNSAPAVRGEANSTPPPPGEKGPDGRPAPYYGVIPVDYDDKGETSGVGGLIPQEYEQDVIDASKVSGIPTSWIAAQIEAESR